LLDCGSEISVTGFSHAEIDELLLDFSEPEDNTEDEIEPHALARPSWARAVSVCPVSGLI
jgi:hypothetical protein